jgi:hypothetical protein
MVANINFQKMIKPVKGIALKRFSIICLLYLISFSSSAQGFFYGVQAGFCSSSIIEKSDVSNNINKSLKFGYQLGISAEYEIMNFLSISSSVSFLQKGDKVNDEFATSKASIGYVDIPVTIGYKVPIGDFEICANVGPYTSIAVVGTRSFKLDDPNVEPPFEWNFEDNGHAAYVDNTTPVFGDEWNSYKRFDSGINLGIKLGWKRLQLSAVYSKGFIDIKPNEAIVAKNSAVSVSVVYLLKYY